MVLTEAQKRAMKKYYLKNREHIIQMTMKTPSYTSPKHTEDIVKRNRLKNLYLKQLRILL